MDSFPNLRALTHAHTQIGHKNREKIKICHKCRCKSEDNLLKRGATKEMKTTEMKPQENVDDMNKFCFKYLHSEENDAT